MLDGLLYHESDLDIREHYTDTAGFTDHVFALMHLLGFAFCPRTSGPFTIKKLLTIKGKGGSISGTSFSDISDPH
ncbi:tn3 transposase DDE domain protein [Escherichia coli MP020940.1]|nr:tn3 transposase DDE domain protein [Escherichia coli MP020940.1]